MKGEKYELVELGISWRCGGYYCHCDNHEEKILKKSA
jgi:hypothetical protein